MVRALFFEYPEDPTSWLIEDQYLFGTAPRRSTDGRGWPEREVYLPPGSWIDYQGGRVYEGARWHSMRAGRLPVALVVRDGAVIPHADLAQSTGEIDWHSLELKVFCARATAARRTRLPPRGWRVARLAPRTRQQRICLGRRCTGG